MAPIGASDTWQWHGYRGRPASASGPFCQALGARGGQGVGRVASHGLGVDYAQSPLFGWAGWNHLERATALAALYQERKDRDGWDAKRLTPPLAGLLELVPWLKQWHNEPSAEFGGE